MKILFTFCIVGIALFSGSCKKGKSNVVVRGTISDLSLGGSLSGVSIQLIQNNSDGSSSNIGTSQTSTTGEYRFEFPRDNSLGYSLLLSRDNYFTDAKTILFSSITIEEDNVRNYGMYAESWVKMTFTNLAPNPSDVMKITKVEGRSGCMDNNLFLNGSADTVIVCENNGNTLFSYSYQELSGSQFGDKSVNTTSFDTTEILLEY